MSKNRENARIQLVPLAFVLAVALAACSGAADAVEPAVAESDTANEPTEPEGAVEEEAETAVDEEAEAATVEEPAAQAAFTITIGADAISVPDGIPAGLVELSIDNVDSQWHAAIIRQLSEDVSLEDFAAAFEQEPRSTMPMTTFVGEPDVPGETTVPGYYTLNTGTYVVVDNWVEPWRFVSFEVNGETVQAEPPEAGVSVQLNEYAIEMPESLPDGSHLWQFTNDGQFPHNVGFIRLADDQSVDDVVSWLNEPGPEPFEYFGMWNIISPGVTSWGELELQPGDYLAVDMMPDFASEGGWNVEQGMYQTFTVTSR